MTIIKLKHSATAGNAPASLAVGEFAFNEADGLLFFRSSTGTVLSFPLATAAAPGDILFSFDGSAPARCLELDGATITNGATTYPKVAARYAWMVSSNDLKLPDARGRFARIWAHGSTVDPDRASRTARAGDGQTGDYVGTYQDDDFAGHNHSNAIGNGFWYYASSGSTYGVTSVNVTWLAAQTNVTATRGGNETRGTNLSVSCWMRMG